MLPLIETAPGLGRLEDRGHSVGRSVVAKGFEEPRVRLPPSDDRF